MINICLLLSVIFSFVLFVCIAIGVIYRSLAGKCYSKNRIDGKTVLITGASAGIGKAAAEELARRGCRLILACRNLEKSERVAKKIIEDTGNSQVIVMKLDTSDMKSVEAFADNFRKKEGKIDILINNAGTIVREKEVSPQGFELAYATNYLGHFLLTNLLLDMLKTSKNGRIINVSSILHKLFCLDFDDIHFERRKFSPMSVYAQSKLCNILFSNEMARKLKGTGVTCNSMHPGVVSTEIVKKDESYLEKLISFGFSIVGKTSKQGAETIVFLTIADEVKDITGEYFVDCKVSSTSKESKNRSYARRLWEISENQSGLTQNKYD